VNFFWNNIGIGIYQFHDIFLYFLPPETFTTFWSFSYRACIVRFSALECVKLVLGSFILTKRDAPFSEFYSERKQQACFQVIISCPDKKKISLNTEIRIDAWSGFCQGNLVSMLSSFILNMHRPISLIYCLTFAGITGII